MGAADGSPRLHALRRPGRRRHGRDGPPGAQGLLGIHVNLFLAAVGLKDQLPAKSEQERAALDAVNRFTTDGSAYFQELSTRPQTIGYSLLDSAVGLAA